MLYLIFCKNKNLWGIIVKFLLCANVMILNCLRNFNLISLKTSVGPVGNMHDLEITLHEISISLIYIDLCHQVHWYGGRRGCDTLKFTLPLYNFHNPDALSYVHRPIISFAFALITRMHKFKAWCSHLRSIKTLWSFLGVPKKPFAPLWLVQVIIHFMPWHCYWVTLTFDHWPCINLVKLL